MAKVPCLEKVRARHHSKNVAPKHGSALPSISNASPSKIVRRASEPLSLEGAILPDFHTLFQNDRHNQHYAS